MFSIQKRKRLVIAGHGYDPIPLRCTLPGAACRQRNISSLQQTTDVYMRFQLGQQTTAGLVRLPLAEVQSQVAGALFQQRILGQVAQAFHLQIVAHLP